jgi:hypothetical protein
LTGRSPLCLIITFFRSVAIRSRWYTSFGPSYVFNSADNAYGTSAMLAFLDSRYSSSDRCSRFSLFKRNKWFILFLNCLHSLLPNTMSSNGMSPCDMYLWICRVRNKWSMLTRLRTRTSTDNVHQLQISRMLVNAFRPNLPKLTSKYTKSGQPRNAHRSSLRHDVG